MRHLFYLVSFLLCIACSNSEKKSFVIEKTVFETSNGLETATYKQVIDFYTNLALTYPEITIDSIGKTDFGYPLHLICYKNKSANKNSIKLLINNGIHPGEADGIDATMLFFRDLAKGKINTPKNTVVYSIPIYNIGGALNRNSTTRTNQNGPKQYGFRGNARNYDLNRDFIKCDTKNAKTFAQIFHQINPDVFIDNHVSNGADYQYTLTHLFTQHNKLGNALGDYLHTTFVPKLETNLRNTNWDITPYVNVFNKPPEDGFSQFMDYPRYSTGYTTLFNTLGMMIETHMLKPYKQRVEGTYQLMKSILELADIEHKTIKTLKQETNTYYKSLKNYPLHWKLDSTQTTTLDFKGFESNYVSSKITGKQRLQFNPNKPFTKPTTYYNYFKPKSTVTIPEAYIIPKGWHTVIDLLKLNNIEIIPLKKDTTILVESYKINQYNTRKQPYEGHYLHYNTKVTTTTIEKPFLKGDCIVYTKQNGIRYLLETLEPMAIDSFFNWNFFDTILQQKEHFSPYVWEDKAEELLKKNPKLKQEFDSIKLTNSNFKNSWYNQLDWLHKQSANYEKVHLQYPIYRLK